MFPSVPTEAPLRSVVTIAYSVIQNGDVNGLDKFIKFWNEPCVQVPWVKGLDWYNVIQASLIANKEKVFTHLLAHRTDVDMDAMSMSCDTALMCATQARVPVRMLRGVLDNGGMHSINNRDMLKKTALDYSEERWEGHQILIACGGLTGEEIERQIKAEEDYQRAQEEAEAERKKKKKKKSKKDDSSHQSSSSTAKPLSSSSFSSTSKSGPQAETSVPVPPSPVPSQPERGRSRSRSGQDNITDREQNSIDNMGETGGSGQASSTLTVEEQLVAAEMEAAAAEKRKQDLQRLVLLKKKQSKPGTGEAGEEEAKGFWESCCCCPCCCCGARPVKTETEAKSKPKPKAQSKAKSTSSTSASSSSSAKTR